VTRLLVSVRSAAEAEIAVDAGAGLIDAKDPSSGALGPLSPGVVRAIVDCVAGRAPTSAAAGDDEDVEALVDGTGRMAATGVSFVKLGLGGAMLFAERIRALAGRLPREAPVVAVLAAEDKPAGEVVRYLAKSGFRGAMIDTRSKTGTRLTELISTADLARFVAVCRTEGLVSGLAGSLRIEDIEPLTRLDADYLGLRGGLCVGGRRAGALDPRRVVDAVQAIAAQRDGPASPLLQDLGR
jgi:(5-formylfuran-3-yl)methyl phosphate synthase